MLLILIFSLSIINVSYCQKPVLPPEFGAIFFGTNIGKTSSNLAVIGEIYVSKKRNMSATVNRLAFDTNYEIFDYTSGKVLLANEGDKNCDVLPISSYEGGVDPQTIMDNLQNKLKKSKELSEINGITAIKWTGANGIVSSFADPNWNFATKYGNWSHPLFLANNGIGLLGHTVYNVYYYLDVFDEIPEDLFAPPLGILCRGFDSTVKERPVLATEFRLDLESYDSVGEKKNMKSFYNRAAEIVREDVIMGSGHSYSVFRDEHFGVMYMIDYDTGKCLSATSLDPRLTPSTPNQLSNLSEFHYQGNRKCWRGVCEIWSGSVEGVIHEIYFKKTVEKTSGQIAYIPVQMYTLPMTDYPPGGVATTYHYFNYEPGYVDWTKFDISDCFNDNYKLRFQVTLLGNLSAIENIPEFERKFRIAITQHTRIPLIRMQGFRINNFFDEYVVVTLTLLEEPKYTGISSLNEDGIRNFYVYYTVSNAISAGTFIVATKAITGKEMTLKGYSITRNIISEAKIEEQGSSLVKFKPKHKQKFTVGSADLAIEDMTVEACAKQCDREFTSTCDLFMFCPNTRLCALSLTPIEERKDVETSTSCNLYTKDYAFDFDLIEGLRLTFDPKTDITVSTLDLEDCFSQCFRGKTDAKICHSIDYCNDGTKHSCIFHARHLFQADSQSVIRDSNCLHYSMKFLQLFAAIPKKSIKDSEKKFTSIKYDISPVECAKNCMFDVAGCTDFEMCATVPGANTKSVCKVMEPKTSSIDQEVEYISNTDCDHYRLKGLKTDFIFGDFGTNTVPTSSKSTSYGGGDMAGLGIAMALVGILFGFFAVYFYAKKQYTRGNEDNFIMQLIKD